MGQKINVSVLTAHGSLAGTPTHLSMVICYTKIWLSVTSSWVS